MKKQIFYSGVVALLVSVVTFLSLHALTNSESIKIEHLNTPVSNVLYTKNANGEIVPLDFTQTVDKVVNSVVSIKSSYVSKNQLSNNQFDELPDPFKDFFGDDQFKYFFGPQDNNPRRNTPQVQIGTGSGVIINENGYIITNNHVVDNADDIEVTLHDNRTFKAKLIGTDPSTDLALIQVDAKGLPALPLVNSDEVKVGEWVLAVGNPFGLNSTVTAGIVSAMARNINIVKDQYAVESFIQTDAAINPGNSGGALVNIQGGLVGINTAIASPTGAYSGYGFAIPSKIVNKVVEDLLKYGVVQRGVLGIQIRTLDGNLAKEKDLEITEGVYVDSLIENSAAGAAGIKPGDVILSIDNEKTLSSPKLQEIIASHKPGDKVNILVNRKGSQKEFVVTLNNRSGNTSIVKKEEGNLLNTLGCELKEVDSKTAKKLGIEGGIKVTKIKEGKLRRYTQMKEGFIITHVYNQPVKSIDDLIKKIQGSKDGVMLQGVYEDIPGKYYYAFGL
jgi:Do/DeqQ family serine protease